MGVAKLNRLHGDGRMSNSQYVPGTCNIGRAEIRLRWIGGWIGVAATLLLLALLVYVRSASAWRLLVFFPATLAALGFLQAVWGFCVKFGWQGVFNLGPSVGRTDTVEQAEFRRKDRRSALLITSLALVVGLAIAVAAYLAPL
jgi:hypothetical protein